MPLALQTAPFGVLLAQLIFGLSIVLEHLGVPSLGVSATVGVGLVALGLVAR